MAVYVEMEVSRRGHDWKRPPRRRGKKKVNFLIRNIGIVYVMAALMDVYGCDPTKRSDNSISASEIAGAIVQPRLGHKAVEEVWRVYGGAAPTVPGFWAMDF